MWTFSCVHDGDGVGEGSPGDSVPVPTRSLLGPGPYPTRHPPTTPSTTPFSGPATLPSRSEPEPIWVTHWDLFDETESPRGEGGWFVPASGRETITIVSTPHSKYRTRGAGRRFGQDCSSLPTPGPPRLLTGEPRLSEWTNDPRVPCLSPWRQTNVLCYMKDPSSLLLLEPGDLQVVKGV